MSELNKVMWLIAIINCIVVFGVILYVYINSEFGEIIERNNNIKEHINWQKANPPEPIKIYKIGECPGIVRYYNNNGVQGAECDTEQRKGEKS